MAAGYVGSVERRILNRCVLCLLRLVLVIKTSLFCSLFVLCGVSVSHKKAIPVFLLGRERFGDYQSLSLWFFDVKNTLC